MELNQVSSPGSMEMPQPPPPPPPPPPLLNGHLMESIGHLMASLSPTLQLPPMAVPLVNPVGSGDNKEWIKLLEPNPILVQNLHNAAKQWLRGGVGEFSQGSSENIEIRPVPNLRPPPALNAPLPESLSNPIGRILAGAKRPAFSSLHSETTSPHPVGGVSENCKDVEGRQTEGNEAQDSPEDCLPMKRKAATRETTSFLKTWLREHRKNPYPTKEEKIMLATVTRMNLTQVSTWFANARRRLKKENRLTWSPRNRSFHPQSIPSTMVGPSIPQNLPPPPPPPPSNLGWSEDPNLARILVTQFNSILWNQMARDLRIREANLADIGESNPVCQSLNPQQTSAGKIWSLAKLVEDHQTTATPSNTSSLEAENGDSVEKDETEKEEDENEEEQRKTD